MTDDSLMTRHDRPRSVPEVRGVHNDRHGRPEATAHAHTRQSRSLSGRLSAHRSRSLSFGTERRAGRASSVEMRSLSLDLGRVGVVAGAVRRAGAGAGAASRSADGVTDVIVTAQLSAGPQQLARRQSSGAGQDSS